MDDIRAWLSGSKDWQQGKELYFKHGRELQLRTRLQRAAVATPLLRGLLEQKLRAILASSGTPAPVGSSTAPAKPPETKPAQPKQRTHEREREELEVANSRLYSQRALLANRLRNPMGREDIRLENCRLIDQIEEIHATMLINRERIRAITRGDAPAITPEEQVASGGKIVVTMREASYTREDLGKMSPEELGFIREKLRQHLGKARRRATTLKTEKGKKQAGERAKQLERELALVDKIRAKHGAG